MSKEFNRLAFILAAVSDDSTRYFMCKPYLDVGADGKKILVATDGRRMHYWELSKKDEDTLGLSAVNESSHVLIDAKKGTVAIDSSPDNGQFPNWRWVLPGYSGEDDTLDLSSSKKSWTLDTVPMQFCARNGIALNMAYLRDIYGKKWAASLSPDRREERAVAFVAKDDPSLHAVIMPMAFSRA